MCMYHDATRKNFTTASTASTMIRGCVEVAFEVVQPDLDRGEDAQHDRDEDVLARRRVRPDFARQHRQLLRCRASSPNSFTAS